MKRNFIFSLLFCAMLWGCATPLSRINGDLPTKPLGLQVEPTEAKVYLDNLYVGLATSFTVEQGGLPLTAGVHHLTFKAEGYMDETIAVTGVEESPTISVRLLPKPDAPKKKPKKKKIEWFK